MVRDALTILEAVIGFNVLIFVHELGHFLAARWQGIRVEVFSLGFGPVLWRRKVGQTEYRVSAVPLGGFVKMAGEEPQPDRPPAPDEFYGKSVGSRALVFVAGVLMNIIFGFLFFIVAYQIGVPSVPARVGGVEPGSPAWRAGLRRGDVITKVNGIEGIVDFEDVLTSVLLARRGEGIPFAVERNGSRFEVTVYPEYDRDLGRMTAGIMEPSSTVVGRIEAPGPGGEGAADFSAISRAGLKDGDRITAVWLSGRKDPIPVRSPADFIQAVALSEGKPVRIAFERNGIPHEAVTIEPVPTPHDEWVIGITFGPTNVVREVMRDSWAARAGIAEGDAIVAVGDEATPSGLAVEEALDRQPREPTMVKVLRGGEEISIRIPPRDGDAQTRDAIAFATEDLFVAAVARGYPADKAGIRPGDRMLSVNGVRKRNFPEFHAAILESRGQTIALAWDRDGKRMQADVEPVRPWVIPVPWKPELTLVQAGAVDSFVLGLRKSAQWVVRIYAMLRGLLRGTISHRHLSGPIGIAYITYAAAKTGLGKFLYFLGMLSVNLGVINLLPIPILDGGHLLFAGLEKVRGRPISERIRAVATYAGLGLIVAVFLLAFRNDIGFLIRLILVG